jgi:hypothetical protein
MEKAFKVVVVMQMARMANRRVVAIVHFWAYKMMQGILLFIPGEG